MQETEAYYSTTSLTSDTHTNAHLQATGKVIGIDGFTFSHPPCLPLSLPLTSSFCYWFLLFLSCSLPELPHVPHLTCVKQKRLMMLQPPRDRGERTKESMEIPSARRRKRSHEVLRIVSRRRVVFLGRLLLYKGQFFYIFFLHLVFAISPRR